MVVLEEEGLVLMKEEGWKAQAACKGKPVAMFYPDPGYLGTTHKAALEICQTCPVKIQCGEYAIANKEPGIWGGLTEADRRKSRRSSLHRTGLRPNQLWRHGWEYDIENRKPV